jgi:preprotein translocase subunit SecA
MLDVTLRPWLTPELVTVPSPERERVEQKWWDRICYTAIEPLRRKAVVRSFAKADIAKLAAAFTSEMEALDDAELGAAADHLRPMFISRGFTPELSARSFALIREVTGRKLGMRHRPVQLAGGYAMLCGHVAEMRTGEGKTITALLPAATAALAGMPVHVVTVNDYLAERDAEQLRPVYEALGLSVGLAIHGQQPPVRSRAYACDVLYACNKELVFDYLRDRNAIGRPSSARVRAAQLARPGDAHVLMRGLHFAIVDEADGILIDEARTPLIISREHEPDMPPSLCETLLAAARRLEPHVDFTIAKARRMVRLTPKGQGELIGLQAALDGHWKAKRAREELVEQALAAFWLYRKDQHYIIADGKIQIVDEFTGRTMPDRQWQRGLQQLIEAKEGCSVTGRRETLTQITYQRFFRRYLHLSGMTGTATEVMGELASVYSLSVVTIPTHRPDLKRDLGVSLYNTSAAKWQAVVEAARMMVAQRRAVLIGTRSVEASETLAGLFIKAGLPHVVLNARNEPEEAKLVAAAGEPGRITIATNMAGRGTDIQLSPEVAASGGLHVILTEYHESGRIDRQLFGRCGRQGDPGSYQAIVSLEDHLFELHAGRFAGFLLRRKAQDGTGDEKLPVRIAHVLRYTAQSRAERLQGRIRRATLRMDSDLEKALAFAWNTKA